MLGLLYNVPILEAYHAVGQLGKLQIVGDHHQCLVKDIHGHLQKSRHILAGLDVKAPRRFVGQNDGGPGDQRPGNGGALLAAPESI